MSETVTRRKRLGVYCKRDRHGARNCSLYRDLVVVEEDGKEVAGAGRLLLSLTLEPSYWWRPSLDFRAGVFAVWPLVLEVYL